MNQAEINKNKEEKGRAIFNSFILQQNVIEEDIFYSEQRFTDWDVVFKSSLGHTYVGEIKLIRSTFPKLLLEKHKYDALKSIRDQKNYSDFLYVNIVGDSDIYIFRLRDLTMPPVTIKNLPVDNSGWNQRTMKEVYMLPLEIADHWQLINGHWKKQSHSLIRSGFFHSK